jgi:hypothetical protein
VKGRLVAAVQGGEIDGLDGIVELLPVLRLAVGKPPSTFAAARMLVRNTPGSGWPG